MTSNNDKDDIYKFSFDGITLGEAYRQYRKLLLDEAAYTHGKARVYFFLLTC